MASRMEKTAIVTGATAGIGKEVARKLAAAGYCVVLACRSIEAAGTVKEELLASLHDAKIEVGPRLDLSSLKSIKSFVDQFGDRPVSLLINNAGANLPSNQFSDEGIPMTMQVNYVGPCFLTRLLLPHLKSSPDRAKVVNVASVMHRFGYTTDAERLLTNGVVGDYRNSKLALVMFSHEFQRRFGDQIDCCSVDPGAVHTKIFDRGPFDRSVIPWLIRNCYATPEDAARTILHAVDVIPRQTSQGSPFYARGIFAFPLVTWYKGYTPDLFGQCLYVMFFCTTGLLSLIDYTLRKHFSLKMFHETRIVSPVSLSLDIAACQLLWERTERLWSHCL